MKKKRNLKEKCTNKSCMSILHHTIMKQVLRFCNRVHSTEVPPGLSRDQRWKLDFIVGVNDGQST